MEGHGTDFPRGTSPADTWIGALSPLGRRGVTAPRCHVLPQPYDANTWRRRIGFAFQKHHSGSCTGKGLDARDARVKRDQPGRLVGQGRKEKPKGTTPGRMKATLVRQRPFHGLIPHVLREGRSRLTTGSRKEQYTTFPFVSNRSYSRTDRLQ